ncbi:hypothetical protein Tco_0363041 [Tanacetum coccineum]
MPSPRYIRSTSPHHHITFVIISGLPLTPPTPSPPPGNHHLRTTNTDNIITTTTTSTSQPSPHRHHHLHTEPPSSSSPLPPSKVRSVGCNSHPKGLVGKGTGIATKVLKSMGINLKDARVEVEELAFKVKDGLDVGEKANTLLQSFRDFAARIAGGIRGEIGPSPVCGLRVREMSIGNSLSIDGFIVIVRVGSVYISPPPYPADQDWVSLLLLSLPNVDL